MPYIITWDNPAFPAIAESPTGDSWPTVARRVTLHHLQATLDHLRAVERLIADVSNDNPD